MSEIKGTRALELWCKRLVKDCPGVQIENMTTSWRNGLAFCALVHHFRPELIDMSNLKPENIYENNQLAFSVAEKHLGIPALLDPEDMVENDVPDRLSVLTYLSQFYQRLGHTVNNSKVSESENKTSATETPQSVSQISAPLKFGKTGLDKCTACSLPVYLAQRLMVSHKLYHRRCFRCSKCLGHLNPKNHDILEGSEFTCDSCKNEKNLLKYLNNNDCDQMGMLAFGDSVPDHKVDAPKDDVVVPKAKPRTSILEKINMFEQNSDKDTHINSKIGKLSLKDNVDSRNNILNDISGMQSEVAESKQTPDNNDDKNIDIGNDKRNNSPDKVYKSNIDKFNFLQTQLTGDSLSLDTDKTVDIEVNESKHKPEDCLNNTDIENVNLNEQEDKSCLKEVREDKNITDDLRISKIPSIIESEIVQDTKLEINDEIKISVPPRRKKLAATDKIVKNTKEYPDHLNTKEYPDHLNPFGTDDEEEINEPKEISTPKSHSAQMPKKESTNPFGSSDEDDDVVPPIQPPPKVPGIETSTPVRRLIAVNPFWSDGEEPSSDEDINSRSTSTYTSMATSTPNLRGSTPHRKKPRAPPPPALVVTDHSHATSMDDIASISSLSSLNSTAPSDQKSYDRTPVMKKKRPAPTPPESISAMSECGGSLEKGVDLSDFKNASGSEGGSRRLKGPAPGLPLPERREVKLQMSPEELQVQLDLLETQQLGLERQGVLIERMIRDKCEGDEACTAPQEEVEDLVIQLCELVNEKNDLFRKQTELMYIRRQQRLEQEQADIEHEIRIIQSRPAVNRIDADKAREEQLVSRLVEIVRMRDELVQQIDAERRRERQEDLAIAASIASKRAQRNSDSNTSMKSAEVSSTHKKNKVKDKVKKHLKKAKHTLISKKKDDSSEKKEDKIEKEKDKKSKN